MSGILQNCPRCRARDVRIVLDLAGNTRCTSCAFVEDDALFRRPKTANAAATFHAHLDVCSRCRNEPFNLCATGQKLIENAVTR